MKPDKKNKSLIHCESCNKAIDDPEPGIKDGIAHCIECDLYFLINSKVKIKGNKISVSNAGDHITFQNHGDELEIKLSWLRNFNLFRIMTSQADWGEQLLYALAFFINRTTIIANAKFLKVEQKPLEDFIPMTFYASGHIKQIFVELIADRPPWEISPMKAYGLFAELHTGEEKLLLWDLRKSTLSFIEKEINKVLFKMT